MSQSIRLVKNTLWLLLARFGTQGLMVLFTLLVARRLGEAGFGEYAFVASAIFFANSFATFGTDMLLIREIASGSGLTQLPAALTIQLALSALFVALAYFFGPMIPGQSRDAVWGLQLYSLALFPLAFCTVFTAALRGKVRMEWYTLLNVTISLLQLVGVWVFVQPGRGVAAVALILLLVQLVAAVMAGLICAARIPGFLRVWQFKPTAISTVIYATAPIALLGVLGIAAQKLGVYMLSTLAGAAMTGWFSAALRVVEASKTGHLALFGALYPAMAHAHTSTGETRLRAEAFTFSWKTLLALAGMMAIVLFFVASPLVPLLYGPGFEPAIPALKILAWMLVPYTINTYLSLSFLAAGHERSVALALLVSLILLAALNAWWIPSVGLIGACWAALIAEIVQAGILLLQGRGAPFAHLCGSVDHRRCR